jgi:hypothetical protein
MASSSTSAPAASVAGTPPAKQSQSCQGQSQKRNGNGNGNGAGNGSGKISAGTTATTTTGGKQLRPRGLWRAKIGLTAPRQKKDPNHGRQHPHQHHSYHQHQHPHRPQPQLKQSSSSSSSRPSSLFLHRAGGSSDVLSAGSTSVVPHSPVSSVSVLSERGEPDEFRERGLGFEYGEKEEDRGEGCSGGHTGSCCRSPPPPLAPPPPIRSPLALSSLALPLPRLPLSPLPTLPLFINTANKNNTNNNNNTGDIVTKNSNSDSPSSESQSSDDDIGPTSLTGFGSGGIYRWYRPSTGAKDRRRKIFGERMNNWSAGSWVKCVPDSGEKDSLNHLSLSTSSSSGTGTDAAGGGEGSLALAMRERADDMTSLPLPLVDVSDSTLFAAAAVDRKTRTPLRPQPPRPRPRVKLISSGGGYRSRSSSLPRSNSASGNNLKGDTMFGGSVRGVDKGKDKAVVVTVQEWIRLKDVFERAEGACEGMLFLSCASFISILPRPLSPHWFLEHNGCSGRLLFSPSRQRRRSVSTLSSLASQKPVLLSHTITIIIVTF